MASCSMTTLHGSKGRQREGVTRVNAQAAEPYTVLIADDHQLFRDGLRALLASAPQLPCVGEAAAGDEAAALPSALHPHVVRMGVRLPGGMIGVAVDGGRAGGERG